MKELFLKGSGRAGEIKKKGLLKTTKKVKLVIDGNEWHFEKKERGKNE